MYILLIKVKENIENIIKSMNVNKAGKRSSLHKVVVSFPSLKKYF